MTVLVHGIITLLMSGLMRYDCTRTWNNNTIDIDDSNNSGVDRNDDDIDNDNNDKDYNDNDNDNDNDYDMSDVGVAMYSKEKICSWGFLSPH